MASLLHVGRDLAAKRDALRVGFEQNREAHAGASVVGDVLIARFVSPGGSALRRGLIPAIVSLRDPRPLPRYWSCGGGNMHLPPRRSAQSRRGEGGVRTGKSR